ncbi:hypothetical protein [Xylella fastidiosa]|uniref:hypothetical protein n=1 Tax=Xylella fastidiosa TaxID=2371 RepID=UPI000FEC96D9|nr:hypothetical protein [Xylella fastidiosa]MRU28343.1 hypothetical protein [Xylella fastidiosa subsp. multiplex]MRU30733.1 hypothetical protein [Xylella fastidiosa subsp. multiplex]UIT53407.1 hypothetical protein LZ753_11575 [Xylella fastidiosa subsp. fastidiosa]WLE28534.1 hypothetical protein DVS74_011745 [Xylella fastidiosa subsp. multiplex]
MKIKPSLDEFRGGGSDSTVKDKSTTPVADARFIAVPERISKTIRIRKTFETKLKEDAFHCSQTERRRVTESDIIDMALEFYWAHKE